MDIKQHPHVLESTIKKVPDDFFMGSYAVMGPDTVIALLDIKCLLGLTINGLKR